MKINFDGASKGNPGIAGCGVVLRDKWGKCKIIKCIPIGNQTNHVAEAMAPYHRMVLAKEANCTRVWCEGDSLNIINYLNKKFPPSWTINNAIKAAKKISETFEMCVFTHVYREANLCADWATNLAYQKEEIIIINGERELPCEAKSFLDLDHTQMRQHGTINHNF